MFWVVSSLSAQVESPMDYLKLSEHLVKNLKTGKDSGNIISQIESSSFKELTHQLYSDEKKLSFWINIYNGYIKLLLDENPEQYDNKRSFFSNKQITIAGKEISFSQIEHGIIRRSQIAYGLGYLRKWFPGKFEKKLRVRERDYRVHFALNCGALSCPPITIYNAEKIDDQLNFVTREFLKENTTYDPVKNSCTTTPLFSWFRGDFGGKRGIKKILIDHNLIPNLSVKLKFAPYDWSLLTDQFIEIK